MLHIHREADFGALCILLLSQEGSQLTSLSFKYLCHCVMHAAVPTFKTIL